MESQLVSPSDFQSLVNSAVDGIHNGVNRSVEVTRSFGFAALLVDGGTVAISEMGLPDTAEDLVTQNAALRSSVRFLKKELTALLDEIDGKIPCDPIKVTDPRIGTAQEPKCRNCGIGASTAMEASMGMMCHGSPSFMHEWRAK